MEQMRGRVVVVTGAASGIGRALAERFASEGLKVVLADVQEDALAATEREMAANGAAVLAVRTDVANAGDVEALAEASFSHFGGVHIVCNNAGVAPPFGLSWERTLEDWQWVIDVNLWGVIHGIRSFVPRMLELGEEGHILNTASEAGLTSSPGFAIYYATKHAVVSISESLHHDLAIAQSRLNVSVLCPWWVQTGIFDSERNRPPDLQNKQSQPSRMGEIMEAAARQALAGGIEPSEVADRAVDAIKNERFYIITHPEVKERIRIRMDDVLEERNPVYRPT